MAPHSSTLARKIPWMEEPGRLQSMGSLSRTRLSIFTFTFHFHALEKEMATHSSVPAWRIPGMGEPRGLPSMGSHRVGHDWSDLAAAAAAEFNSSTPNRSFRFYEAIILNTNKENWCRILKSIYCLEIPPNYYLKLSFFYLFTPSKHRDLMNHYGK